jgi:hypothetical protein
MQLRFGYFNKFLKSYQMDTLLVNLQDFNIIIFDYQMYNFFNETS